MCQSCPAFHSSADAKYELTSFTTFFFLPLQEELDLIQEAQAILAQIASLRELLGK